MTNELTLPFDSAEFKAAWEEFEQHRREIKAKLTPTSTRRLFKKFAAYDEARVVAAIHRAVESGWRGVFPESERQTPSGLAGKIGSENAKFRQMMESKRDA